MKNYSVYLTKDENGSTFSASNSDGYEMTINGLSGEDEGRGISPMEMMLSAAGGCACIDVVCLLKQAGEELDNFTVKVNGSRNMRETPAYFREVELLFTATGVVEISKLKNIVELSLQKYCTVGRTLEAFSNMSWSLNYNSEQSDLYPLVIDKSQDSNEVLLRAKNNLNASI